MKDLLLPLSSGEKPDGKQTQQLIENSIKNGMDVKVLIGDMAYSEQDNIDYCKQNNIKLVSKLNTTITNLIKSNSEFYYNKDAGMFVCKAGHMATRKSKNKSKEIGNVVVDETYFFNVNKCQVCPYKENCYKEGSKTKSYHHRVFESNFHEEHLKYQESENFKSLSKSRYKIEAKNAELKNRHGYDKCSYSNLTGMQLQSAMSIFVVNIKRIITLKNEIK